MPLCSTALGACDFPLPPHSLHKAEEVLGEEAAMVQPKLRLGIIQWHLSGGSGTSWSKGEKGGRFRGIPSWKKHESEEKGLSLGFRGGWQPTSCLGTRRDARGGNRHRWHVGEGSISGERADTVAGGWQSCSWVQLRWGNALQEEGWEGRQRPLWSQ